MAEQYNQVMSYANGMAVPKSADSPRYTSPPSLPGFALQPTASTANAQSQSLSPLPPGPGPTMLRPLILVKDNYYSEPKLLSGPQIRPLLASPNGSSRKKRAFMPEERKDEKYWEKRRRNNAAARRSREKRKMVDVSMEQQIHLLSMENSRLHTELEALKKRFNVNEEVFSSQSDSPQSIPSTSSIKEKSHLSSSVSSSSSSTSSIGNNYDSGVNDDSHQSSGSVIANHLHTLAVAAETVSDVPKSAYRVTNDDKDTKTSSDSGVEHEPPQTCSAAEGSVAGDTSSISSRGSGSDNLSFPLDETSSKDTRSDTSGSQEDSSDRQHKIATLKSLPHKLRYKIDSNWGYSESSSTSGSPENPDDSPNAGSGSPVPVGFMNQTAHSQLKHKQYLENRMRINLASRKSRQSYKSSTGENLIDMELESENSQMRRDLEAMKRELEELKKQFEEQKK